MISINKCLFYCLFSCINISMCLSEVNTTKLHAYDRCGHRQNHISYDSLTNIGYHKETKESIRKYIGQHICFLMRSRSDVPKFYANFDYDTPIVVDTIWIKKKKNHKKANPKDYKLVFTTSWIPYRVNDEEVVLAGSTHYHNEKTYFSKSFIYRDDLYMKNDKHDGYFTHYKDVEGRLFQIVDVAIKDLEDYNSSFILKLKSEDDQILYWTIDWNKLSFKDIAYPVYIKGYIDKIKDTYLYKYFYFKSSDYKGDKYYCNNVVFRPDMSGYYSPFLELVNESTQAKEYLRLITVPKLFSTDISEKQLLCIEDRLVDSGKFERERDEYIREQLALEKEKEQNDLEHKKNIIRKYGDYYGKLILQNKIKIGMTKEMVLESWGKPYDINRIIGEFGVEEQWCYHDTYLYFENDRLVVIQD